MMRGSFLIGSLALMTVTNCAAGVPAMTADEWQEDLDFLTNKLTTVHPAPYHWTSKDAFDRDVAALRQDIPRLKDYEIAVRMMQLTGLLGDGHTGLDPTGDVVAFDHWFPVRIERFEEGWFITAATKAQSDLIGAEVVRIGTLEIADAASRAMTAANGDNTFTRLYYSGYILAMPKATSALGINGDLDRLGLTVRNHGVEKVVSIPAISAPFGLRWFFMGGDVPGGDSVSAPLVDAGRLALCFRHSKELYWFQYLPESGIFYVNLHLLVDRDKFEVPGWTAPTPTLAAFFESMWKEVDRHRLERIILDIRNNGGGDNQLLGPLLAGFEARPELNRHGKVFVITGRRTYSAAMNLVALMEQRTNAIFVGEPAGGAPRHSGDATSFRLPHSKMSFNVSVFSWDLGAEPWDVRDRVQPELLVPPRAESYFAGRDPALEAIEHYSTSPGLVGRMVRAFDEGGVAGAMALLERQRAERPEGLWNAYEYDIRRLAAQLATRGGHDAEVLRILEHGTRLHPDLWRAWFWLGLSRFQQEDWPGAVASLKRAAELNPREPLVQRLLAASMK